MAQYTVRIDEALVADAREKCGSETDEQAIVAAVEDAAKRLRREEFFDAIDSGSIDLGHDARNEPGQGRSAA